MTGIDGARDLTCASRAAQALRGGLQQRAVKRRRHRQQQCALGAARLRSRIARSTAALLPAITICPGALKLTGSTTSPCAASRHASATAASSAPMIAAIAPTPAGDRLLHRFARESARAAPRPRTSSAPAATSAVYSPRLWPGDERRRAPPSGLPRAPDGDARRQHHRLRVARQVERVRGPLLHQLPQIVAERFGRLGERRRARPDGRRIRPSCRSVCEPWPGNTNATVMTSPSNRCGRAARPLTSEQHRAPGEAAADAYEHHVSPRANAAVAHRDVERERNRRRRRVAVQIDRRRSLSQRQLELACAVAP